MCGHRLSLGILLLGAATAAAEPSDDTLHNLLAKGSLCVAGRIESAPVATVERPGSVRYACDFAVTEVLAGVAPAAKTLRVDIVRFEMGEKDRSPMVEQGAECILFLKQRAGDESRWETVDHWSGVQRHGPALTQALKRLVAAAPAKLPPVQTLPLQPHLAGLPGTWLLTLPIGKKFEVELRPLGARWMLENAARFSGGYEVRDDRLILTVAQESDKGFAWALAAPDELILVGEPNDASQYSGARMKRQKPPPEKLPLDEHLAGLPGTWLMTLPAGKQYEVLLRSDGERFILEKAVRFSGGYDVRDNRLLLTNPPQADNKGFAWELAAPDELILVEQPTVAAQYLGARMKRQGPLPEKPAAPEPKKATTAPKPARATLPLNEHLAELPGTWLMTLPAGKQYEVVLRASGTRFVLEKAVRFSGTYEVQDNRLVLADAPDPVDRGFAWEVYEPDELTLVAQPQVGTSYVGARLKRQGPLPEKPAGKKAAAAAAPQRPPLPLADHVARLPGRWRLTLPAGKEYEVVLRRVEGERLRLEKAVRFSGDHEVRDNRLVLRTADPGDVFAWELRSPDELVLVAQPANAGGRYLGAILKQLVSDPNQGPAPAPAAAAEPGPPAEPPPPPANRSLFYLPLILALVVSSVGVAFALWWSTRAKPAPVRPDAPAKISIECVGCGQVLRVRAGRKATCPACGAVNSAEGK